jgi:hypothetical protein
MMRRSSETYAPMKFLVVLMIGAGVDFFCFFDMNLVQGSSNLIGRRQNRRDKCSISLGSLTITNRHLSQLKLLNKIRATYMSTIRSNQNNYNKKFSKLFRSNILRIWRISEATNPNTSPFSS